MKVYLNNRNLEKMIYIEVIENLYR